MPGYTPAAFKTEALAIVALHNVSTVPSSEQNNALNRAVREFTRRSKCLYSESATFTLTASVGAYSLIGGAFSQSFFEIDAVVVDGKHLLDFQGRPGPVSWTDLEERYPSWRTEADAMPRHFLMRPPRNLYLFPEPDQAYTNSFVSGWYLHPEIDWTGTSDATILVPETYQYALLIFCAAHLVRGGRASGSDFELLDRLDADAGRAIRELFDAARSYEGTPAFRGRDAAEYEVY